MRDRDARTVRRMAGGEVKQIEESGRFVAAVGRLGEVGRNRIVYEPGLLQGKEWPVTVLIGHDWGMVPAGKAMVREDGEDIIADGRLNLSTQAGRELHAALQFDLENGPPVQEWSLGFFEVETEDRDGVEAFLAIEPIEVSAVLRGGAARTRTVRVQEVEPQHKTETSDAPWSASTAVGRLPSPVPLELVRQVYAWHDSERVQDGAVPKAACKLPHHFVDSEGKPGAASTRACIAAIAALNGARGGVDIPESERKAAYEHLAAHLRDAGEEPPELQDADTGIRLSEEVKLVLWDVEALVEKLRRVSAARSAAGRKVSAETLRQFGEIAPMIEDIGRMVATMSAAADVSDRAQRELARWKELEARLAGWLPGDV